MKRSQRTKDFWRVRREGLLSRAVDPGQKGCKEESLEKSTGEAEVGAAWRRQEMLAKQKPKKGGREHLPGR